MRRILLLARHGQTEWNLQQRIQGWTDLPLTDQGRQQAERLAETLKSYEIRRIFASDLRRARETAEIVAQILGIPMVVDHRLREVRRGELEGYVTGIAELEYPEFFEAWRRDFYHARPPGGESPADAEPRARAFFRDWWPCLPDSVIVGHLLMNLVLLRVLGVPLSEDVFQQISRQDGSVFEVQLPPESPIRSLHS